MESRRGVLEIDNETDLKNSRRFSPTFSLTIVSVKTITCLGRVLHIRIAEEPRIERETAKRDDNGQEKRGEKTATRRLVRVIKRLSD